MPYDPDVWTDDDVDLYFERLEQMGVDDTPVYEIDPDMDADLEPFDPNAHR